MLGLLSLRWRAPLVLLALAGVCNDRSVVNVCTTLGVHLLVKLREGIIARRPLVPKDFPHYFLLVLVMNGRLKGVLGL